MNSKNLRNPSDIESCQSLLHNTVWECIEKYGCDNTLDALHWLYQRVTRVKKTEDEEENTVEFGMLGDQVVSVKSKEE